MGIETLQSAAVRELKEEAGISTDKLTLAYIEEMYTSEQRECKFWFFTDQYTGTLKTEKASAERESIVDVKFIAKDDLSQLLSFLQLFWNSSGKILKPVLAHLFIQAFIK